MGAAAVGAVVKEAVRCRLTAVAVKLPPVIAISVASFALPWKVPATLTVPEVSRNALLAAPKVEVPLADNDPTFTKKPCPPRVVPAITPPPATASLTALLVVVRQN